MDKHKRRNLFGHAAGAVLGAAVASTALAGEPPKPLDGGIPLRRFDVRHGGVWHFQQGALADVTGTLTVERPGHDGPVYAWAVTPTRALDLPGVALNVGDALVIWAGSKTMAKPLQVAFAGPTDTAVFIGTDNATRIAFKVTPQQ